MSFGERFMGMFGGESRESAKAELEQVKKAIDQNAKTIEAQGRTTSFLTRLRESTATKFVALAALLVFSERVVNAQEFSVSQHGSAKQESMVGGGEQNKAQGEERFDVVEVQGDQVQLHEQDTRSYARHYDAEGRINTGSITGGVIEKIKQDGGVYKGVDVTITTFASAEGDTGENIDLANDSAQIVDGEASLIAQQVAEELGMNPSDVHVHAVSGGEQMPQKPDGSEFKDKQEFMSWMQHELGMSSTQLTDAIHTYNGMNGKDAQKKQSGYIARFFDHALRDQRNPTYDIKLTPESHDVLVGQSVPIDVDNRIPGEVRAIHDDTNAYKEPYIAREEDEAFKKEEDEDEDGKDKDLPPEPKKPVPPTVPEPTPPFIRPTEIFPTVPESKSRPDSTTHLTPGPEPVPSFPGPETDPTIPRVPNGPDTTPVIPVPEVPQIVKPRVPSIPEIPTVVPRVPEVPIVDPNEVRPRVPDIIDTPPVPETPPIIDPDDDGDIDPDDDGDVLPPIPLPPPPPPRPEFFPVLEGQGSREIQAMKRSVVDEGREVVGVVGDSLPNNTGRQKVELDESGDATWIGSRQSGARLRAEGAGAGDKSTGVKQRTIDRDAERAFIKKNKQAELNEE